MRLFVLLMLTALLMTGAALADELALPEGLRSIGSEAFMNDTSIDTVRVPDGVGTIGARAFANSSVRYIYLPDSVTFISGSAFDGCTGVTAYVSGTSYAYVYCSAHSNITAETTLPESLPGSLQGSVRMAGENTDGIAGAGVELMVNGILLRTTTTSADGSYAFDSVPNGRYMLRVTAEGYVPFDGYAEVHAGESTYMETFLMVEGTKDVTGTAMGTVTDAFTRAALPGINLRARSGWNNESQGQAVGSAVTDGGGRYTIELPAGNYTLTAIQNGYATTSVNIVVLGDTVTGGQDLAMAPAAGDDEFRIKLTWGKDPSDLDSHIQGRTPGGTAFHIYYRNRNINEDGVSVCNLDVDDVTSYGPEVITVKTDTAYPYYYYVHHYAGNGSISASSARVEVYRGGKLERVFNAPSGLGSGRYWNVFAIINGRIVGGSTVTDQPATDYQSETVAPDPQSGHFLTWSDGTTFMENLAIANNAMIDGFSILTDRDFSVSAPDWITVAPASGAASVDKPISIHAAIQANDGAIREGDIVISADSCAPLIIHIRQDAGDTELTAACALSRTDGDGNTDGILTLDIIDHGDPSLAQAENVTLIFDLGGNLVSDQLDGRKTIDLVREGDQRQISFTLSCNPTLRQSDALAEKTEEIVEKQILHAQIMTDNAGSYEYSAFIDAYAASDTNESFEVAQARHILDRSSLRYDISDTTKPPHRIMIEPLMQDPVFQSALTSWRTANFNIIGDELAYTEKELDYYRGYVYSVIYADEDSSFWDTVSEAGSLLGDIKSFVEVLGKPEEMIDTAAGVANGLYQSKQDPEKVILTVSKFFDKILKDSESGTLDKKLSRWVGTAKVYKGLKLVPDVLSAATAVGDFLERVIQISHLSEITNEKRALLDAMAAGTDNPAMKAAISEYADLLPALNPAVAAEIIAGEETVYAILKKGARAAYALVVEAIPQIAIVQAGRTLADVFFDTSSIISAYYECEAGILFENALIAQLRNAITAFEQKQDDETAVLLLAAVESFYNARHSNLKAADSFAKTVLEGKENWDAVTLNGASALKSLKRAVSRAVGKSESDADYENPTYVKIHKIIEEQKTWARQFMSTERRAAAAGYYNISRLWLRAQTLERVK